MLGKLNEHHKEAMIIGAGFSGLLAAYRLLQRGWRIKLYDGADRAGGLINTVQTEYGLAESAAHSMRSAPVMDALLAELKVVTVAARTRKKYILREGKFSRFPLGLTETAEMVARAAFLPAKENYANLQDLAHHHLGRAATHNLIHPMMQGIYAAPPELLSPELAFPVLISPRGRPLLWHMLMRSRSNYEPRMIAPRAGMTTLINALFKSISESPRAQVFLNGVISELPDAPNVIIATPAHAAAQILQNSFRKSADALRQVQYAPLVSATVFLDKKDHRAPEGIGVLCAANEPRRALGILFNSATFENRVTDESRVASYTVMLGGMQDTAVMNLPDTKLRELIVSELNAVLNPSMPPLEIIINRWSNAIPLYSSELLRAHTLWRQNFCAAPGRILSGNYTGQISLRGMSACFAD